VNVPGTILLEGVVGSTAYGLATEHSDVDLLGLFAYPTMELLCLSEPTPTHVQTAPDGTWHEARKYCQLVLGCNPTAMELLWLSEYTQGTKIGHELVAIRDSFLSAKRVRDAYMGYATQQFKLLANRGDGSFSADTRKRTEKHARHLRRLIWQGVTLWQEGRLEIRVHNPDVFHEFGRQVADGNLELARKVLAGGEYCFDNAPCALPQAADPGRVESWLLKLRKQMIGKPRKYRGKEEL
jgi:hypothetical protein